jgi:uncharacterized 2Fe-2S/4Fe-4S cluster protein (DUF4445 family)
MHLPHRREYCFPAVGVLYGGHEALKVTKFKNYLIQFFPGGVKVEVEEGSSLLEAARRAGYLLRTECGGRGTCRRCKVQIQAGEVFTAGIPNLSVKERAQNYTLACLARITGDLEVRIPSKSEFSFSPEALPTELSPGEHPGREITSLSLPVDPLVRVLQVQVPVATQQDNASDFDRLCRALTKSGLSEPIQADLSVLRRLPSFLRENKGTLRLLLKPGPEGTEILDLWQDSKINPYGMALDIGTTTLFARLLELSSGEVAAETSDFNWQIPCGTDIIHRIVHAGKPDGLKELRRLVVDATESLVDQMVKDTHTTRDQIVAVVLAGNATMEHLFLGIEPRFIREDPYTPAVTRFPSLTAAQIGLNLPPFAPVVISPCVASYVGGDITAGLLAAGVHRDERLTLYVDLGTNGEVALGNRDFLTACACSAGPAFEGSGVRSGMRALLGAIDQVQSDPKGQLLFRVIGGGSPQGICGSGLIDLLAQLHATGRITARGKFNREADPERIRGAGRRAELLLVNTGQMDDSSEIVISETDLDNLIRTKGAIFAGIMTLLKGVGLEASAIQRVVIAGGFGRYLDVESAIRIGMLPDLPRNRFEYIGNGSLRGAGLALLSGRLRQELDEISRRITYFELSTWPGYMDEFMAALFLPHTDISLFPSVQGRQ